jgi:hypothetical protein
MDARYKEALNAARAELEKLQEQREETDNRITQLKQTIFGLAKLCKEDAFLREWGKEIEAAGITENCRQVLKASYIALTPLEVKDQLLKLGLDASKYTNLLASIHAVLKRLVESQEIRAIECEDGSIAYKSRRWHFRRRGRRVRPVSAVADTKNLEIPDSK